MRIPALLVVHLKRFEGGRVRRTKLNNLITFPIKVRHLSRRGKIAHFNYFFTGSLPGGFLPPRREGASGRCKVALRAAVDWFLFLTLRCRYDLYATVNHMGSIDGGHYIAYMQVMITCLRL